MLSDIIDFLTSDIDISNAYPFLHPITNKIVGFSICLFCLNKCLKIIAKFKRRGVVYDIC